MKKFFVGLIVLVLIVFAVGGGLGAGFGWFTRDAEPCCSIQCGYEACDEDCDCVEAGGDN